MSRVFVGVAVVASWAVAFDVQGQTCPITSPLFCDIFDGYPDNNAFLSVWNQQAGCDGPSMYPAYLNSPGGDNCWSAGGKMVRVRQSHVDVDSWKQFVTVFNYVHDLTPEILGSPGNGGHVPSVNGAGPIDLRVSPANQNVPGYVNSFDRTLRPNALKGQFQMRWDGQGAYANGLWYFELSMDDDHAPYNWDWQYCSQLMAGGAKGYIQPHLIRSDGQVHKAFAIGVLATYDSTPCDLDSGWKPSQDRVVVYDGRAWKELKAGYADIPNTSPPDMADPSWKDGCNRVDFAIGADYIEVRLRNNDGSAGSENLNAQGKIPNGYWVARIPRLVNGVGYTGPFNKVSIGVAAGLDQTVPTCVNVGEDDIPDMRCNGGANLHGVCSSDADCPPATVASCPRIEGSGDPFVDNIELYDGVFAGPPSACCKPDRTCSLLDEMACAAVGGTLHSGVTSCTPNPCCPTPWADDNGDGHVDMADFAALQRCLTIGMTSPTIAPGCICFDKNGDNAVTGVDVDLFVNCASASGPGGPTPTCP